MYGIHQLITHGFETEHSKSQEIPSSSLNSRLEDTTTNQLISTPAPSVGVLTVDGDTVLSRAPWCGDQLELWPLPTDESVTR